jgi:hypothetical protein
MFLKNIQQDIQIDKHEQPAYKDPDHAVNVRVPDRQARDETGRASRGALFSPRQRRIRLAPAIPI